MRLTLSGTQINNQTKMARSLRPGHFQYPNIQYLNIPTYTRSFWRRFCGRASLCTRTDMVL
jgi:hypothetical protein